MPINRITISYMASSFMKLNKADFYKGLVVAVLLVVLKSFEGLLASQGLNLSISDFSPTLDLALNTGLAYLLKNLFSTDDGKFGGIVG